VASLMLDYGFSYPFMSFLLCSRRNRLQSIKMLESVFRTALESGDVAGGIELDDEEISRFTRWALDWKGKKRAYVKGKVKGKVERAINYIR